MLVLFSNASVAYEWDVRTAPIPVLVRWYTLDVAYRLSARHSTGPAIILYDNHSRGGMLGPSYKGQALGWQGTYYFKSIEESSWYTDFHIYYEKYRSLPHGTANGFRDYDGSKIDIALGYSSRIQRFNVMTGMGVELQSHKVTTDEDSSPANNSDLFPWIEFKLGISI